ncbi:MAG TPA: DUF2157 domain-containing protein [Candidatus Omnitrophota bacterium]|mgnify:CR=1 FL=1|nr:DUF2157 domain-containing protein [Candidatus Omnitrophota bacterium]
MKKTDWLNQEIGKWVEGRIISTEQAEKISALYPISGSSKNTAATLFSILGAICLGLGVILLFAYNWDQLGRSTRTVLAFLPLLASGALGYWVLSKHANSAAKCESIAALFFLSIGATMALISQTYHVSDDYNTFFITWMLAGLPLVYFFNAGVPLIFYLAGITFWIGDCQNRGGHALFYWPLFLLALPKIVEIFKAQGESIRKIWVAWAIVLTQTIALGVSLEKSIPGLWMVIYAFYFGAIEWAGRRLFPHTESFWRNPLNQFGRFGILVLAYLLTFDWPWRETGFLYYRDEGRYHGWASAADYVLFACFGFLALRSWAENLKAKQEELSLLGFFPFLIALIFALNSSRPGFVMPELLFNLLLLAYGIFCVTGGWRKDSLKLVNGGLAVIALILVTRFGDSSWGILTRAFIFIALGAGFLVLNRAFSRKGKKV